MTSDSAGAVLILDGHLRHVVDMARSLGSRGVAVDLVSPRLSPAAGRSRYVRDVVIAGDASGYSLDDQRRIRWLAESRRYDAILGAGLGGSRCLAALLERPDAPAGILAPSLDAFETAEDKASTVALAESVGVPVPRTLAPGDMSDYEDCADWSYPLIVKARHGQGQFGYVETHSQLMGVVGPVGWAWSDDDSLALVQEVVDGTGHGYFALASDGVALAEFTHRRIRELPPSGGPSCVAEAWQDERLSALGRAVLQALHWTGVAMVEFKLDAADSEYKLIEINPKFWGSLGLAVAAGVDFPWLAYSLVTGGEVHQPTVGWATRYQWLTMDVAHSIAVRKPLLWTRELARGTPNDFRWEDPLPNATLFLQGVIDVLAGRRSTRPRSIVPGGVR